MRHYNSFAFGGGGVGGGSEYQQVTELSELKSTIDRY